jgi:hypothetical protein
MDDDGTNDLVVGISGSDEGGAEGGAVGIFYAPSAGAMTGADADALVVAESSYDYLGYSMTVGNLDGDGSPDLLVGAYQAESTAGSYGGAVYAILGGGI